MTHIPEAQWPTLIMKNKLTHALRSLPAGSIPVRKGTTLLSNKGYSLPAASKFRAHPGMPKCNRLWAACISPHAMGLGELCSLTERDSSFPCSTPGVVPLVPTCIHELISLSQPVYGQFTRNTKDNT